MVRPASWSVGLASSWSGEAETRQGSVSVLPLDGKLICVSQWRRQIVLAVFLCYVLIFLAISIAYFTIGGVLGVVLGMGAVACGLWACRVPFTGLILDQQGVKIRAPLWTYHYSWHDVQRFELVERPVSPYMHRFRVHLRDGRVKKVRGFYARGPAEEERRRLMLEALEERLAHERGHKT